MKPTRIFATATLVISSFCLVTAASISVGDEPGVVRMAPRSANGSPTPTPDSVGTGVVRMTASPTMQEPVPQQAPPVMEQGVYPQPGQYAPYFERSYSATEAMPPVFFQPAQPFGPIFMFESNIGEGLGYNSSYQRLNTRIPYHIIPDTTVLMFDANASVTNFGDPISNVGLIYRNYDEARNRILGYNLYVDYDQGLTNQDWTRAGFGLESLGQFLDFRANGYFAFGDRSALLSAQEFGGLIQGGNFVFRNAQTTRENAYSGFDTEVGGPLPFLGRYGFNLYGGTYYLNSSYGESTIGGQGRLQALINQNITVNTTVTSDDHFGTNSWVSLQYEIPNYNDRRTLKAVRVRDRLSDPVNRSNRIHSHIDSAVAQIAQINPKTGLPYFISYVNPNLTQPGNGTFENPFNTLQALADSNSAGIDLIRVTPRADDSGTNLTVNGGLTLYDCQRLIATTHEAPLFTSGGVQFGLAAVPTTSGLGPLVSDPTLTAGDSVIRLANQNEVIGFRIDASNSTQTIIGTGISTLGPIHDVNITDNTFTNYETALFVQDVSGRAVIDNNDANGIVMAAKNGAASSSGLYSKRGLVISSAPGQELELLVRNNTVNNSRFSDPTGTAAATTVQNDQTTVGISVTAKQNSKIFADDPLANNSTGATGILGNIVTDSGDGIVLNALAGSEFHAVVENNQSYNNDKNGLVATADGVDSRFNLYSMRNNLFGGEDLNANGVLDVSEDINGDGVLDTGEDLDGDRQLDQTEDINGNGVLDNLEDVNGNGILDLGEDTNGNGILDAGEDEDFDGILRPAEDINGDGLLAAGNGENGVFLHYLNGGSFFAASEDRNDDRNFNGIQDNGETVGADGVFDRLDGTLTGTEDLNDNGRLDLGIISNQLNSNGIAGLCIVGEGDSDGLFTIGGPTRLLGNRVDQNSVAGIGVDLRDDATIGIDSMFNTIGRSAKRQTLVTNVSATLQLTGNTFNAVHTLTNASTNTLPGAAVPAITNFNWDLTRPVGLQGWEIDTKSIFYLPVFDANGNFTGNYTINNYTGNQFRPLGGTDANTQLQFVNGFPYNQNNVIGPPTLFFPFGVLGYATQLDQFLDGAQNLSLDFGNFLPVAPNDQFVWQMDTDRRTPNSVSLFPDDTVFANQLNGTNATVTFRGDFDGDQSNDFRTFSGTLFTDPNDAQGVRLAISAAVVAARSETSPDATGHGIAIRSTGSSQVTNFSSINDTMQLNKGDGLTIAAYDNSRVNSLTLQGANIDRNDGRGVNIEAHDQAVITANSTIGGFDTVTGGFNQIQGERYSEGNTIVGSVSDGVRVLASNGGRVDGNLINNTISNNGGHGANLVVDNGGMLNFGNLADNERIYRNMIQNNTGAGLRISSGVTAAGPAGSVSATVQDNMITDNAGGGIVSTMSGSGQSNQIDLVIGGSNSLNNTIDGNGVAGVSFEVSGNGVGNIDIQDATITDTAGDGIVLRRRDASLLTADIGNSSVTRNSGSGLLVDVRGSGKEDPNQPERAPADGIRDVNLVNWNNSEFSNNGVDGASFSVAGSAQLIADGENNVANNNGQNGVSIITSGTASFGDATGSEDFNLNGVLDPGEDQNGNGVIDIVPPGRRVRLNGLTASNNGNDGVNINVSDDSRALVEITSIRTAPEPVGSHAGLNNNGNTSITGNVRDGIRIESTGGRPDVLITSSTGSTEISSNGQDGVHWNSSGDSDGIVRVTKTDIISNGDDGVEAVFSGNATSTLLVGGAAAGNNIQSNGDDGIAITVDNSADAAPVSTRPVITIIGNEIGGTRNGVVAGNRGDGVSLTVRGRTATGLSPGQINTDLANGPLSFNGGVTATGAIPQFLMTGNEVSNNAQRGVNVLMTGAGGTRNRENGNSVFDPILITMDSNTISSNGTEGIFVEADADMNQSRFVYLPNFPFPNPPFNPADDRPQFPAFYDPLLGQFTSLNAGSVNGNTAYLDPYLNLRTVQNSFLTITNNAIQSNGVGGVSGEGLHIRVGTGSYVAADVQGNAFGGNRDVDFRTESFLSAGETFTSVDDSGNLTFDAIYLDDTAQLDLRFQNNSGNQILASDVGATYTTLDPLKEIFLGTFGATNRDASLFQVDNGPSLNNPNNQFTSFGVTQDIQNSFTTGNYNLRGAADPLFPNIGFAPFLP